MSSRRAATAGRQATSLLVLLALLLFPLLSRADLALADLSPGAPTVLCSGAASGTTDPSQTAHRACVLACATVCQAQILPASPGLLVLRGSQALIRQSVTVEFVLQRRSTQSLRIRGPPGQGIA